MRRVQDHLPPRAILIAVPAIAVIVHLWTLWNGFTYDDNARIQLLLSSKLTPASILHSGRGLTYLFHLLDYRFWGEWAPGFHLTNLLLHAIACLLVIVAASVVSGSARVAGWTGLIFAVHPVHVEVIASFSNRKDILALVFCLISLILWRVVRFRLARFALAMAAYILAMFSKEAAAVALPLVLVVADLLLVGPSTASGRMNSKKRFLEPALVLMTAVLLVAYFVPQSRGIFGQDNLRRVSEDQLGSYPEYLANVAAAVPRIVRLMIFPATLSADYPVFPGLGLGSARAVTGLLEALAIGFVSAVFLWRCRVCMFGMMWMLIMYLPSANIIPLIQYFGAERYLYGPSFGLCLLAGVAIDRLLAMRSVARDPQVRRLVLGAALAVAVLGAARSAARTHDWRDELALWKSSLSAGIETYRVRYNVGVELFRQGRMVEAAKHLKRAVALAPRDYRSRRWLAASLLAMGRLEEAEAVCADVAAIAQEDPICAFVGAELSFSKGDMRKAMTGYHRALTQEGDHLGALLRLSRLLSSPEWGSAASADSAVLFAERALDITKSHGAVYRAEAWRCLVGGLRRAGRLRKARVACWSALAEFPGDSELLELRRELLEPPRRGP